ncbi:hypothetical protein EDC01DRAFT_482465 [Geopyxis carbonaria]|nr:hypothetical protein EDC01DRAFT_482465 [Geopyxis carbonaria]
MMKVNLKYQLCGLVSLTALSTVGVLTLVTWFYTYNLVFDLRADRLEVIASLKSKELSQSLLVYSVTARSLAARVNIANALALPENHPNFTRNWTTARQTFSTLLSTYSEVVYVSVQNLTLETSYMNLATTGGYEIMEESILNMNSTMRNSTREIFDVQGTVAAYECDGAPPGIASLVPFENVQDLVPIKVSDITADGLFLGPLLYNRTYVASLTVPVYNNTTAIPSERKTLGFMTVVFNIVELLDIVNDTLGLGNGQVLVLGPDNRINRWENSTGTFQIDAKKDRLRYLLPPKENQSMALTTDVVGSYPVAVTAWQNANAKGGISATELDTKDSFGKKVAVGYSTVTYFPTNSSFLLLVEQDRAEAFRPMSQLRKIVLASVFGMFLLILIVTVPIAHFAVRPIRRLHKATKLRGRPPEYREEPKRPFWHFDKFRRRSSNPFNLESFGDRASTPTEDSSLRRETFRIPQKVAVGNHWITDELTVLSCTFNGMTDELLAQYENLDAKVRQRTEELEQQKALAEAANEAKTMFIANVSHELRTPLNGILGMCTLVLEDERLSSRIRENLEVVFKSGELLQHLLNDLLTFSKNQVWGASVKLEAAPFRVRDLTSQVMAVFGAQAKDKGIELTCEVVPSDGIDWVLTGDVNRILQVVINLVNNSLKFTPEEGSVQLSIVIEPNTQSTSITPYSDITEKPDYITFTQYKENSPPVSPPAVIEESIQPVVEKKRPAASAAARPVRPTLFSRRSASTGIINPASDHNKSLPHRFRKLLSPGGLRGPSRSSSPSNADGNLAAYFVEFRVIDTGPGVPDHLQSKIFEPFIQGDAGLSRKYGGTGLGLSICQQLAKLMGGTIMLKSFEGAGSTFTLRIPLQSAPADALSSVGSIGDHRQRSVRTTARSISMLGSVGSAAPHHHGQDGMRLVGLSQPFFVPSRNETEEDLPARLSLPDIADRDIERPETPERPVSQPAPTLAVVPPAEPASRPIAHTTDTFDTGKTMVNIRPPTASTSAAPPSSPNPNPSPSPSPTPSAAAPLRVLVVEDNKVNQKVLIKLLQLEGITAISVAEDGAEAVDAVRTALAADTTFSIIFMDIQMPNVDGHAATKMIRGDLGYGAPIVALTAFADESNVSQCFESGMDCFLAKPVKRRQIRDMLRLYCGLGAEEKGETAAAGTGTEKKEGETAGEAQRKEGG